MRSEIQWLPVHDQRFLTWGTEVNLYEIETVDEDYVANEEAGSLKVSNTSVAHLQATNNNCRYFKCIDIYPQPGIEEVILAIGQATGKVLLSSFGPSKLDLVGREFSPRHVRPCNALAWNVYDPNIIGVGLEKYKADHAVLLWDVVRCPYNHTTEEEFVKPVLEVGLSETANSFAWINSSSFVCGLSNKSLKIIDRRDPARVVNTTLTKAVYGAAVDAQNEHFLASFVDNQICVWDDRNFEKPISSILRQRQVMKISWCPTRNNVLGTLQRDSSVIMLHDLQLSTVGNDEVEPALLERPINPNKANTNSLTSFAWHPRVESRLLALSLSGQVTDYQVVDRITLNWLPGSHLVWTHGRRTMKLISEREPIYEKFQDLSSLAKSRAIANYGLQTELWQNGAASEEDSLVALWNWLYHSKLLVDEGFIKSVISHPGVLSVVGIDPTRPKSEKISVSWCDMEMPFLIRVYTSEAREQALLLCNSHYDKDMPPLPKFLEQLEARGSYSRAAAISVFNLRLKTAINILTKGAADSNDSTLGVVAMALAGFSDDKQSMWREHCVVARSRLTDPYLRATFAFLTAEEGQYDGVLNESGMAVEDRVAFACRFLSDSQLNEFLHSLSEKLTDDGDPCGLLLTGASSEGVKLLQRYIDRTGDVQTASLVAIRALPSNLQIEPSVQNWIASYQQFLDTRKLWDQRAHFDIMSQASNPLGKPLQRVFISCTYCGKSISPYMPGISRMRSVGHVIRLGPTNNKNKVTSCPSCRKPLPRCAVCLVHMGTPSATVATPSEQGGEKLSDIESWFTWCQSCRHGGHAGHVQEWFLTHSECPVTSCTCRCLSLDSLACRNNTT